jgi:hypothetical protein
MNSLIDWDHVGEEDFDIRAPQCLGEPDCDQECCVVSETAIAEPATESPAETPESNKLESEGESPEDIKKRARKPPADGPCRGCGKNVPLNRLMLCYTCWVKKELTDKGWREGQPHPDWCKCEVECASDRAMGGFGN